MVCERLSLLSYSADYVSWSKKTLANSNCYKKGNKMLKGFFTVGPTELTFIEQASAELCQAQGMLILFWS